MTGSLIADGDENAYYCGCWREAGHYVWTPQMAKVRGIRERELAGSLDSRRWQPNGRQGAAKVTHLTGWTILSFADRSVDHRGGSHSTFALRGQHDFASALTLARATFPAIFERFDFPILEADADA